ncbi:MAG: hypothetical protein IID46_03045 [Planctomycetes bacterium]|nr:hypothetical protein [Planctomycetota bacterium]
MNDGHHPSLLPDSPSISDSVRRSIEADYERFANQGLPASLEEYLADHYRLDVSAEYAGSQIRNPWGKASGQLSMTARQVEEDVEAGLGFIVLKTVIAQDETGSQSMEAWAIKESRMVAEPVVGKSGEQGWTISWKGRGWWQSFDDYLQLIRDAQQIARSTGTLIVPSCKYHLPTPDEDFWKISEYEYTTQQLLKAWQEHAENENAPMPLEKDFSPTLAGSDRATTQAKILEWLRTVPRLIREAAQVGSDDATQRPVRVGLKIFNALFDDDFQLEMLNTIHAPGEDRPDFYIFANRLFDPNREFDGHQGIAYGGPDLSDRNLRVMSEFIRREGDVTSTLPWCATGNIVTGKMALEYALRGASSFQLHTFFQLPADQYRMTTGSKIQKALNELYFHPQTGFIVWMHHLADVLDLQTDPIRFRDVIGQMPR